MSKTTAKLRRNLETAVADLKAAEASFLEASQGQEHAHRTASATHTLRAKAAKETAHDQILERAAEVEAALEAYREQFERDYASEMEKATVTTRALHVKRQEAEQALRDLERQIAVAAESEAPFVSIAVGREREHSEYAQGVNEYKLAAVRLTHDRPAAAA